MTSSTDLVQDSVRTPVEADGTKPEVVLPAADQGTGGETLGEGDAGTTSRPWMAQLPDDLKVNAELAKHATLGDYVKSTLAAKPDGKEGEVETPPAQKEPVKYTFEKSLDADSDPFGTITGSLRETLEGSGVPEDVAVKVIDSLMGAQASSMKQLVETGKDWCEGQLKKTWGSEYKEKRAAMTRAYVALVEPGSELAAALDRTGASINPAVAELLSRIGSSIGEDGALPSNRSGGAGGKSRVPVTYPE